MILSTGKTNTEKLTELLDEADQQLQHSNVEKRTSSILKVLAGISNFLKDEHPTINRRPLMRIIEEFVSIKADVKTNLFDTEKNIRNNSVRLTRKKTNEALIVAGMELLIEGGMDPNEVCKTAAEILGKFSESRLEKLRKAFHTSLQPKPATDLMAKLKDEGKVRGSSYDAGIAFLTEAKKNLK